MDVDIAQVQYFVELITETGDIYELDNAIQTLAWEEQEGQLAQKATITISSHSTENGALIRSLLKINRIIRIHANWGAETVRGDNLGMAVQPFRKARPQHHRLRPDDPAAAEQGFLLFFRRNVHPRHPQRNLRGMGRDGGLPVEPADNPRKKGVQLRDRERHDHQTAGGSPAADGNKVCRNLQGRQAGHSGLRHKHRRVPV